MRASREAEEEDVVIPCANDLWRVKSLSRRTTGRERWRLDPLPSPLFLFSFLAVLEQFFKQRYLISLALSLAAFDCTSKDHSDRRKNKTCKVCRFLSDRSHNRGFCGFTVSHHFHSLLSGFEWQWGRAKNNASKYVITSLDPGNYLLIILSQDAKIGKFGTF